jgi:hypothetical protein
MAVQEEEAAALRRGRQEQSGVPAQIGRAAAPPAAGSGFARGAGGAVQRQAPQQPAQKAPVRQPEPKKEPEPAVVVEDDDDDMVDYLAEAGFG